MYQVSIKWAVPKTTMPSALMLDDAEVLIRIVDTEEMSDLNSRYRNKPGPTNVLSFPFETETEEGELPFLGDIVICAPVVNQEAINMHKPALAHWAHMVIHGSLHLMGFDHETDEDALRMEPEETRILQSLGFPNPYQETR
jgi:probable rRNA maturation factor